MTAFVDNARSFSSTHSVEPIMPDSSAPQLQNLMVRLGRQPNGDKEWLSVLVVMKDDHGDMEVMIVVLMVVIVLMIAVIVVAMTWL